MMPSSSAIPFVKANACGNDFLIIEGMHAPADLAAFTRRICDRHEGVGADGVEWLFPATDADIRARLFNADGSEAEISGNGTRCVAAYRVAEHGGKVDMVRVRDRGHIEIRIFERGVGETRSSGTGSCAAAVASIAAKKAESLVQVEAPGGVQTVRWEGEVFLRGPAQLACRGEFF